MVRICSMILPRLSPLTMEDGAEVVRELLWDRADCNTLAFFRDIPLQVLCWGASGVGSACPLSW